MSQIQRLYSFLVITVWVLFITTAPAFALTVSDIRIGLFENKTRFVIDLSEQTDYRVFLLDNPERVVIDLPSFKFKASLKKGDPTGLIKKYRYGRFNNKTSRLVLDANAPLTVINTYTLPPDETKPHRLVIDLKTASREVFKAELKTIHGSSTDPIKKTITPPKKPAIVLDTPKKKQKPLIVIDAGHGGKDPGAHARNGILEKKITLLAAKNLRNTLLKTGRYRVKLTRSTDIYHKLRKRYKIARDAKADIFISLHADSMPNSNVTGASVYTLSQTSSDKETAKLAEQENKSDAIAGFDLSHEDEDVADILIDLTVRDTMNHSKSFADTLVKSFKRSGVKTLPRAHRYAGFAVLKAPDIPSVLIEIGFLSSSKEAKRLNTSAYRSELSKAMLDAIDRYFKDGINETVF